MPANLTPEYFAAERKFRAAATPEEKLAALEEMLATIPKHKGTEKMQADIKRRLAKTKAEMQRRPGVARHKPVYLIQKEGAGQIILMGPPNSGKSSLLKALTSANPEVAPYPFTTHAPLPGMVRYENIQMQLVDLPPIDRNFLYPWLATVTRAADAVLLVFDLSSDDLLTEAEEVFAFFNRHNLRLLKEGKTTREAKRALVVANKADQAGLETHLELLKAFCGELPLLPVSATREINLEELKAKMFGLLEIIRVYTKPPGKKPTWEEPFVVKKGTTVFEAAAIVHKEIASNLKFARVWGKKTLGGQMVSRDYMLEDGDVVEFHA